MKLSKLYCNDERFKNITFNLNGLNVIYADVKAKKDRKRNSHDLGKTLLSKLIDFLFLKEINKQKHFLFKLKNKKTDPSKFEDYVFYLEIQLNSGKFLTIRRSVATNTKISFKENNQTVNNFQSPSTWDYENEGIRSAKEILAGYLAFSFFADKDYDFRKAINYSLRMQGDYEDVYRLSKFQGGQHIYWKPFMFDLLGFKGELLSKKYESDKQIEDTKDFIKKLKNEYAINVDERDEIVAQIDLKTSKVTTVTRQIDQFNFYEQDQALIDNGVNKIETSISNLNSLTYNLEYEINRLQSSIKNNFSFDLNKIKKVFNEVNIFFPDNLEHDYSELLEFNNKLTKERNKLLKKTLAEKTNELRTINQQLQNLNKEREELLSYLQDTEVFEKFKFLQKGLVIIQSEMLKLEDKLKAIDNIIKKQHSIKELQNKIEDTVEELQHIYQNTGKNTKYSAIRKLFHSYYKKVMNEDAFISWKLNLSNNVEFNPPKIQAQTSKKEDTAKDEGRTYKKLLCVVFDLAILTAYNEESYFRFVYHDDVLSQQDNGIKLRLVELINELTISYDLQYILSVIKADLPTDELENPIYFSDEEIILKLHDKDETGTLFGFEF